MTKKRAKIINLLNEEANASTSSTTANNENDAQSDAFKSASSSPQGSQDLVSYQYHTHTIIMFPSLFLLIKTPYNKATRSSDYRGTHANGLGDHKLVFDQQFASQFESNLLTLVQ